MKLDVNALRYLSREDFRVLTAVEMGQKNMRVCASRCWRRPPRLSVVCKPHHTRMPSLA
jgi:RIO kinase 2